MKVKDLISRLEDFDREMEVVFQPNNSMYADAVGYVTEKELRSFFGKDREVVVIESDGQVGAV